MIILYRYKKTKKNMTDNHDLENFNIIEPIININDILIDVGSNRGIYTDFFRKKLNGSGKIYSIELCPDNCRILNELFSDCENIIVLNNAVTNSDKLITYFKGNDSNTNNIIGHDMNYNINNESGLIAGIRLDTLLNDYEEIKLIKIDVEGAEYSVLQGMSGIINKIKFVLVECHLDNDWNEIRNLLLNDYNLECINVKTNEVITNDSVRPYQCFCKKK